mgnify:CR=1 FL=1
MSMSFTLSRKRVPVVVMTGLAMLLSACAATPPSPEVSLSGSYRHAGEAATPTASADWWQDLGDPVLDRLVARGLATYLDTRVALARVLQARAGLLAQQWGLLPGLSATGSESDSRSELPAVYKNGEPDRNALDIKNPQRYVDRVADLKANIARNDSDIAGIKRELGRNQGSTARVN